MFCSANVPGIPYNFIFWIFCPPFFKKNISLEKKRDFSINRFFYKEIGRDHFWRDRLIWTEEKWIEYLSSKNVKTYDLKYKKDMEGIFELIWWGNNFEKKCKNSK